ncbi:MAG: DUF2764 family protein [Tidjanibacter sp.]|nr:DUF2764 family protein [Tidjanibacter sp.]
MMAKNYYCLVAGLREYALDSDAKGFDAREVIDEIAEELSREDARALRGLMLFHDVCNLVNVKSGREGFSTLGNFSREEIAEQAVSPTELPEELQEVISLFAEMEKGEVDADDERLRRVDTSRSFATELYAAYYRYCAKSKCRFLREWSEADRNLRNITAALTARSRGVAVGEQLVGEGEIVYQLSRSSAADFGLKGEVGYIDALIGALAENENLLDKEHRIDVIRWGLSEEISTFDYFNIGFLLGYIVRLGLVHRWARLDEEKGRELFRRLVESLGAKEHIAAAERRYAEA